LKRERAFEALKMPVIGYNVHLGLTQSKMASDVKKTVLISNVFFTG